MAANGKFSVTVALTNTLTTNILNPAVTSLAGPVGITLSQPYMIINHIRIINKTAGSVSFTLFRGATGANAAGTELMGTTVQVAANSYVDYYSPITLTSTQFIVGGASANTSLVAEFDGEIGFNAI